MWAAMRAYTGEEPASPRSSSSYDEDEEQQTPEVRYVGKVESIFDLPQLVIDKIFAFFTYEELTKLRYVSTEFDEFAQQELNKGFEKLGKIIETCKTEVKKELPKRESERRKHRLTKINEIYTALDTRYSLLDLTYKKYMQHSHPKLKVCFMPGKVIDEFHRVLNVMQRCRECSGEFTGDSSELLKELRDLSSMAMEYYEEHIQPKIDEYAEKEGLNSYFFSNIETLARRKKTKRMCRDNHDVGKKNIPRLEIFLNQSPAPREIPKTMQDKIDEQQKKIDAQQAEINILKDTVVSTLQFLKSALPNHSYEMKSRFENSPIFNKMKDNQESQPSTSQTVDNTRKRLFTSDDDYEKLSDQPSTSTPQCSKKMRLIDSAIEESKDYREEEEEEE